MYNVTVVQYHMYNVTYITQQLVPTFRVGYVGEVCAVHRRREISWNALSTAFISRVEIIFLEN